MESRKVKYLQILFAIALLLSLFGCAPQPTATPVPTKPVATQVAAPTETPAPRKVVLGYSPPTLEMTDFYKYGERGLRDKAAELGLDLEVITKAPSTHAAAEEQLRIVEDFITAGVDYIWIVPVSREAAAPMIKAANQANIPIFVGHSSEQFDDPSLKVIYVGTNFTKTGEDVGKWIAKHLQCQGPVGMIRGAAGEYDAYRVLSAIAVLEKECPGMEIISSDYTDWLTEKALDVTATMLKAHPNVKLIYCPSSTLTMGAVEAIENAGLTGKVEVLDYDLIPTVQKLVKQGKVVGGLAMFPFKYGEVVAELVKALEDGKQVPVVNEVPAVVVEADQIDEVFPQWYRDLAE